MTEYMQADRLKTPCRIADRFDGEADIMVAVFDGVFKPWFGSVRFDWTDPDPLPPCHREVGLTLPDGRAGTILIRSVLALTDPAAARPNAVAHFIGLTDLGWFGGLLPPASGEPSQC
jgi:hypothetical protein